MNKIFKESILWVFVVLPFIYLWMIWDQLPQTVPTHFNFKGEADDWSDKSLLIYLPCLLGLGMYLLMLIIPRIDPKKKLGQMGEKFFMLRLVMALFFCALSLYILYVSKAGGMTGTNFFMLLIGAFFAGLGNYFQTVRPNYFVGIRTPWTLENEEVWKNTHRLGGKIWMAGGVLLILLALLIQDPTMQAILFGVVLAVLVIVPVVYSYLEFKRIKGAMDEGSKG